MKINKKKILNNISDNKNVFIGVFVVIFVFCICLLPLMNKATYSIDDVDNIAITCPDNATGGTEIVCTIQLNLVTTNIQGISAKYNVSDGVEYVSFTYDSVWSNYDELNYSDSSGFVLFSDGISENVSVGVVKYKIPTDAVIDQVYRIELIDAVIGDGEDSEIVLENVSEEIKIVANEEDDDDGGNSGEIKSDVNTLDSLTLSIGALNEVFDKSKNNYTANVNSDKITITAVATDSKAVVTGDVNEEKTLTVGENKFEIIVTSESGLKNIYTLSIHRSEENIDKDEYSLVFDSILTVDNENKHINYLTEGTTIADLLKLVTVTSAVTQIVTNNDTLKQDSDVIKTGDKLITLVDGVEKEKYYISITGDCSGDGNVGLVDLVQMRKHIAGWKDSDTGKLEVKEGIYYYALDFNKDGEVGLIDLVRMRKFIAGIDD